jgi:hypothetical protein
MDSYVKSADGAQILAMARGWQGDLAAVRGQAFYRSLMDRGVLSSSHLIRFLPAMPGTIAAALSLGLPLGLAGTLPFWILSGAAAALAALWARDLRVGLVVALLPPIQLYASSFTAHEPWFFLATIGALWLAEEERWLLCGALLGLAAWVRPEAIFAALGVAWIATRCKGLVSLAQVAIAAFALAAAGGLLVAWRYWPLFADLLRGTASAPETGAAPGFLTWPGASLAAVLFEKTRPAWKHFYVLAHLAVASLAIVSLAGRPSKLEQPRLSCRQSVLLWSGGHLLFVLSLAGSQGFDDLPRYLGLITPTLAFGAIRFLPQTRWVWALIAAASLGIAYLPAVKNARPECTAGPASDLPQPTTDGSQVAWLALNCDDRREEIGEDESDGSA